MNICLQTSLIPVCVDGKIAIMCIPVICIMQSVAITGNPLTFLVVMCGITCKNVLRSRIKYNAYGQNDKLNQCDNDLVSN